MEFGHVQPSGDCAADPQDMHQTLLSHVQAGDGRPCAQVEQKVLVNPMGVSQNDANTFASMGRFDCSLPLAPDRASKPSTSSSLADKCASTRSVLDCLLRSRRLALVSRPGSGTAAGIWRHEDDLVRSASAAMIASRCSPYLSAFVGPRPCTLTRSLTLLGRASAMAISVASVKTQ